MTRYFRHLFTSSMRSINIITLKLTPYNHRLSVNVRLVLRVSVPHSQVAEQNARSRRQVVDDNGYIAEHT